MKVSKWKFLDPPRKQMQVLLYHAVFTFNFIGDIFENLKNPAQMQDNTLHSNIRTLKKVKNKHMT